MDDKRYAEWTPVSRRQALAGIGTLATGGVGVAALRAGTSPVRAQVSIDEFSVADATFTAESVDPDVVVTIGYDYDVGMNVVSSLRFELVVGETVVASDDLRTDRATLSGETDLRGSVTDAEAWAAQDFAPEVASSVTQELDVTVRFDVLDDTGESIVGDTATDTATVVVSHPQESRYVATVGGSGTVVTPDA
jgi:hypothetical protein